MLFAETELPSMSSAEGSRARTSVLRARVQALTGSAAAYGPNTPGSLANYDPFTSSWRTSQHCFIEGLTGFSETWPRSGTMRNGTAYQLLPLVRLTDETGSGLLPTPEANTKAIALRSQGRSPRNFLAQWPTPRVTDATAGRLLNERGNRTNKAGTMTYGANLADLVRMWPTPTVAMYKGASVGALTRQNGADRSNDRLDYAVLVADGRGQLNPTWVEWLMGFPSGWTDLKHSETP